MQENKMKRNVIFANSWDQDGLQNRITMEEIGVLMNNEENRAAIANWIFNRLYNRFLKLFFFDESEHIKKHPELKKLLLTQFKHGFAMMTNCCLLVETIGAFLNGNNKTDKGSEVKTYTEVFKKANSRPYDNKLGVFQSEPIYGAIRCGLLHQGETYDHFIIRRSGPILDKHNNSINAAMFAKELRKFLNSYREELIREEWNSIIWINARKKINHIISNSTPTR